MIAFAVGVRFAATGVAAAAPQPTEEASQSASADICIYGATPAGINAAVAVKQEGKSVMLVDPSRWLGVILGAGIKPAQDCPEPRAVGGLTKSKIFSLGDTPPRIRENYAAWLREEQILVVFEYRVARVEKDGPRITRLHLEYAPPDTFGIPAPAAAKGKPKTVEAKVFIDASYEGDLMAKAGVSYATGRESGATFHEQPAGVGNPTNWTPLLVGRYVAFIVADCAGDTARMMERLVRIFSGWHNSGEYNYQRASLFTIAPLGISRRYQDGDWAVRSEIWRQHRDYSSGLHYFLSTDPRVPEAFRQKTEALGLDKTMHPDTQGWPNQLYVRITRRMKGRYVLTHKDVLNQTTADDSVGLALFGVDTYPARRIAVRDTQTGVMGVASEGNMFLGSNRGTGTPYPLPYRAITPKTKECTNLLWCRSVSRLAILPMPRPEWSRSSTCSGHRQG